MVKSELHDPEYIKLEAECYIYKNLYAELLKGRLE